MKKTILLSLGLLLLVSGCKPIGEILTDFLAPSGAVVINSGATYTNSRTITLTLDSGDSSEMYVTNTAGCESGGSWEPYATTKSWTLGPTNGPTRVYVSFRDKSQNASTCESDTIILDTVAPELRNGGLSISSPGKSLLPSVNYDLSENATVTLYSDNTCTTAKSAPVSKISGNNVSDAVTIDLTDNATTTLYAKAVDAATNASACTSIASYTADNTAPTVTNVTSDKANGTYKASEAINIQVTFSEIVTVTGTPRIQLATGQTTYATYTSGSGTSTLTFSYTVASGDNSSDLNYSNTSALTLNGGNILDSATNVANLTLPGLAAAGSLATNKAIVIDAVAPTITSFARNPSYPFGNDSTPDFDFVGAGTAARAYLFSNGTCTGTPDTTLSSVVGDAGTITGATLSSNGSYTYSLQLEDAVGNVSLCSSSVSYNFQSNTWLPTTTTLAPSARQWETLVWTGSKMILWGGYDSFGDTNSGSQYDPVADSWTATSLVGGNVPSARSKHSAIWTGSEMIVWGGGGFFLSSGGRYQPDSGAGSWTGMATDNAPSGRYGHSAIWTGSKMIVWGGQASGGVVNTGGIYDPSLDSWTSLRPGDRAPSARSGHFAFWTGSKMIIWGGPENNTGGLYDPATGNWATMSTMNAPTATYGTTAVWTGSKMIVWGGQPSSGIDVQTGAVYDPATDIWTATSIDGNTPSARAYHSAIWTGSKMIIWGGKSGEGSPNPITYATVGGIYDPNADSWTQLSNTDYKRAEHQALWTGWGMIIWGGTGPSGPINTGGIYFPAQ